MAQAAPIPFLQKILRSPWWLALTIFILWRIWLYLVSKFIYTLEKPVLDTAYLAYMEFSAPGPQWLLGWANFDGAVFLRIARSYGIPELPFFPLLPKVMAGLQYVTGQPAMYWGLLIPAIMFPVGLWLSYKLLKLDSPRLSFVWFALVLMSFPTAHYFTALYQDAVFFTLATATVYLARRERWGWAVVAACVAMLSRLNGLALVVFLAAEYWLQVSPSLVKKWSFRELWKELPAVFRLKNLFTSHRYVWLFLLVPLPFVGYLAWIQWQFGDWQLFFKGVEVWNRSKLVFPLQTFWRYAKILALTASVSLVYFVAVAEAAFTALYSWVLVQQWGKLRLSYWFWILAHLTIPVVTGTLQGMPRYGLHLYPLFLVLATWTNKLPTWAKTLYVGAGLAGQVWFATWFLRGYFVM